MKRIYFFLLTLMFVSCTCRNERYAKQNHGIKGEINKAYLNFRFPMKAMATRILFYECTIENNTEDSICFELPYSCFYNKDRERKKNVVVVLNKNDSLNLYCRYSIDRNFKIAPKQSRVINFSLDDSESLYRNSDSEEYLLFIDSLAFVTNEIILYDNAGNLVLKFRKGKDYVMEHRFFEYYEEGEGMKS